MRTRILTVTCPFCRDEIYSRAQHDFHACTCGKTYVDGGFDLFRFSYPNNIPPKTHKRYIAVSKKILYEDWRLGINLYGIYKRKSK